MKIKEAKKLILEERQKKMNECAKEIEEVLKKYNMKLTISQPQITLAILDD